MKKHWYHQTFYECPACGRTDYLRERRYGKKPKKPCDRYSYQYLLGCNCLM
jgi:hypothetical protein